MTDILLIFPLLQDKGTKGAITFPPLNLIFIASSLEQAGYKVKIIDCRLEEDYEEQIKNCLKDKPILVGLTCMTGYQIIAALKLSELICKVNADIPVVWGGVHPSLLPGQTIKNPLIDIIIRNEGELTIVELAKTLAAGDSLKNVDGITYKQNGQIIHNAPRVWVDMDKLPMPSWHLIKHNIKRYIHNGVLRVHSSRGCPHTCIFCYNKGYNKGHRSAKGGYNMADEIEYLVGEFGIKKFHFVDDNFLSNRKRAIVFCNELKERSIKITWGFSIRIDYIKEPLIGVLAEAGVDDCFIGVESGSQRILDRIDKKITVGQILFANKMLRKHDIMGRYSFMAGFPFEEYEDVVQTVKLAAQLYQEHPNTEFNFNNYTPYPGTELYDLIKTLPGFNEPKSLEEWGRYYWSESESFTRKSDYTFEDVHLMWSLNFTKMDRFSPAVRPFMSILQKWASYRLRNGYIKNTPEFHLMKLAGKIFSPF